MKRTVTSLFLALALLSALPTAQADPLPVPTPDPEDPQEGPGDPLEEVEKILKKFLPSGNPLDEHCFGYDEDTYDLAPAVPVEADAGTRTAVTFWHDGVRREGWFDLPCLTA